MEQFTEWKENISTALEQTCFKNLSASSDTRIDGYSGKQGKYAG